MPETIEQAKEPDESQPNKRKTSRLKSIIWISAISVLLLLSALELWQIWRLRKEVADLKWASAIADRNSDNVVTPDVGVIQFLKNGGYSITFDTVKYTADGIYLHGELGNPTNLTISNLSLKFTATKQLYEYREDFDKDQWAMIFGAPAIGESQTSPIFSLAPRTTVPFDVTVPNVKQGKNNIRLVVTFSGERYSYSY